MKQDLRLAPRKKEEVPEQTLPFGIIGCTLLKCACKEIVRKLIEVLKELLLFLYWKGTCIADPLVSLGTTCAARRREPSY